MERNLQDAMQVVRNVMIDPRLVPGGGATEMALAQALNEKAKSVSGVQQWPYRAVSRALEVIPRTLLQNCGTNTIRVLTALRVCIVCMLMETRLFAVLCTLQAKHASGNEGCERWGVDGNTGVLVDMKELGVWDPISVKEQTFKTAIEVTINFVPCIMCFITCDLDCCAVATY